ncbi:MAG: hypothetical protein RLZZ417_332 [Bacteroidota bacterium]|jgi:hypothetical protein
MPKLIDKDKFIDLSDYGRFFAKFISRASLNTWITPVHLTFLFAGSGLLAIYFVFTGHLYMAAFFIVLKSVIDAADGELARMRNRPSYVGRYLDSIFDIILNFLFLFVFYWKSDQSIFLMLFTFFSIQLQGTLYNYYYVILRNNSMGGDRTSQIFEFEAPKAYPEESQKRVDFLFKWYKLSYGIFDKIVYFLDSKAAKSTEFPHLFMTILSIYGLGFQLLLMSLLLVFNKLEWILPVLLCLNFLFFPLIWYRKSFIK